MKTTMDWQMLSSTAMAMEFQTWQMSMRPVAKTPTTTVLMTALTQV